MSKENLKNFKQGDDERRNYAGRPKKFISQIKGAYKPYKLSQIMDAIRKILAMTVAELENLKENSNATILEAGIAAAILRDLRLGKIETIETLLSRCFGKPRMFLEMENITPEIVAAKNLYEQLRQKGVAHSDAIKQVLDAAKDNGFDLDEAEILDADSIE